LLLSAVDAVIATIASWILNYGAGVDILGRLLLLEASALMLIGGAFEFSISTSYSRLVRQKKELDPVRQAKTTNKVVFYSVAGGVLFLELILMAALS